MKKKGFTLIELLAVIVILAIIAVIATPIILGIVENTRKEAFQRSVELVEKATSLNINNKIYEDEYTYTLTDGVISDDVAVTNTEGMNGVITYDKEGNVNYAVYNDKWCVIKKEETIIKDYVEGECTLNDVIVTNYHVDNSITGYNGIYTGDNKTATTNKQNSCLKFYTFNYDNGDTTLNLLLDHNTTAVTYWTNAETYSNVNGPIDAINQLKIDTSSWIGTNVPSDYTVTQTGYGNYTIDYDNTDDTLDYKARLIIANEIAEITGADTKEGLMFDESTTNYSNLFNFDSLSQTRNDTCKSENTTGCSYGWLYDRTRVDCATYGCLNNATGTSLDNMYGYWTATSAFDDIYYTWFVHNYGDLNYRNVNHCNDGVRPVIEVNIDNL